MGDLEENIIVQPKCKEGIQRYQLEHERSVNRDDHWEQLADTLIKKWDKKYDHVKNGGFCKGDVTWFQGGQLNVCVNCVDVLLKDRPDQVAMIWESDEPGEGRKNHVQGAVRGSLQIRERYEVDGDPEGRYCHGLYAHDTGSGYGDASGGENWSPAQ